MEEANDHMVMSPSDLFPMKIEKSLPATERLIEGVEFIIEGIRRIASSKVEDRKKPRK
jgi:hypothetical protein